MRTVIGIDTSRRNSTGRIAGLFDAAAGRAPAAVLLVANAGTPGARRKIEPAELDLITEEPWDEILSVNQLGVFRCAKAAAPALKSARGALVSAASIAGLGRAGSSPAHSATQAGAVCLTQNLARALLPNVRVNAVAPGTVD